MHRYEFGLFGTYLVCLALILIELYNYYEKISFFVLSDNIESLFQENDVRLSRCLQMCGLQTNKVRRIVDTV